MDRLAGLVHRFVGRQVRDVKGSRQGYFFRQVAAAALLTPSADDQTQVAVGTHRQVRRQGNFLVAVGADVFFPINRLLLAIDNLDGKIRGSRLATQIGGDHSESIGGARDQRLGASHRYVKALGVDIVLNLVEF